MDVDKLRELLTNPQTYPHECADIKVIETHISLVFLTGDYAYKIKKPVDFGFLDFSTLEKRRHYCELELKRNRVFAPDVYLQVLGLHLSDHDAAINDELQGAGEYLVKMKQFPQADLLSLQVAAGNFSVEDASALGRQLADKHGKLEQAASNDSWGSVKAVSHPVNENFAQITPLLIDAEQQQKLKLIEQWSKTELHVHHELFQERKCVGKIRACHGDLHLNNILWQNHQAIPFDCIEFNDEFHWIDMISELAFLLMDLEHQDQHDLANHCLNGYLEISGDFAAVRLLKFYKVYRAMVRAKVAKLRQQQAGLSQADTEQLEAEYRSYIALAESYITPTQPCLYITHGVSGSGKTTMARFVAGKIGAIHVRSDVERKRLFDFPPDASSGSLLNAGIYSADATAQTFSHLATVASTVVYSGFSIIVDATFLKQAVRDQFYGLAKELHVPFAILDCAIDEQTARDRVRHRMATGKDASEADLKVLEQQLANQDYLSPNEQRHVVMIDMGKPLEDIEIDALIQRECIAD